MNFSCMNLSEIDDIARLQPEIDSIVGRTWPAFLLENQVLKECYGDLLSFFPRYQFCLFENKEIVGIANDISLLWNDNVQSLPSGGWEWAIRKGIDDRLKGLTPNTFAALSITINPDFQGKGLSRIIIEEIKTLSKKEGLSQIIVPLRPALKSCYPLTPMQNYITWRNPDGQLLDPWLRIHTKCGAEIVKVCPESMRVSGTVSDWETWTKMKFFESGKYVIQGALNPIEISMEQNLGEYIEPNIWVAYL